MGRLDKHDSRKEERYRSAVDFLVTFDKNTAWQNVVYNATLHAEVFIEIVDENEGALAILSEMNADAGALVTKAKHLLSMLHLNGENDHYLALLLNRNASPGEINKRWKALMRIYHPDRKQDGGEEELECAKRINDAYGVLKNIREKEKYDRQLVRKAVLVSRSHKETRSGASEGRKTFRKTIIPACVIACCLVIAVIIYSESRKDEEFQHESVLKQAVPVSSTTTDPPRGSTQPKPVSLAESSKADIRQAPVPVVKPVPAKELPARAIALPPKPVASSEVSSRPVSKPPPEKAINTHGSATSPGPKSTPSKTSSLPAVSAAVPVPKKSIQSTRGAASQQMASLPQSRPQPKRQPEAVSVPQSKQVLQPKAQPEIAPVLQPKQKLQPQSKTVAQVSAPAVAVSLKSPPPAASAPQSLPKPAPPPVTVAASVKERPDTHQNPSVIPTNPSPASQPDKPEKREKQVADTTKLEVAQFISRYVRAYESGDIKQFISFYSRKAMENNKLDYSAIRAAYGRSFEKNTFQYALKDMQYQKQGDAIVIHADYVIMRVESGEKREVRGRITWVLKHEDGVLRIIKADYTRV